MPFETDTAAAPAPTTTTGDADGAWRDRLVELHVLAEHGDQAALGEAQSWIASDERARQAWQEIDSACDRVRRT